MHRSRDIQPLTGLRGIAALLVVATHFAVWSAPFDAATRPLWLAYALGDGVLGMTLFFTLSGFVIAYHYSSLHWDSAPGLSFWNFAVLRFSRLYPALLLFLVLTFNRRDLDWALLHLVSLQTWMPAMLHGALPEDSVYHVSWSISTEAGFYLMFCVAMLMWGLARRVSPRLAGVTVAVIVAAYFSLVLYIAIRQPFAVLSVWAPGPFEPVGEGLWRRWFLNMSPYGRAIEFAIGVGAALVVRYRPEALERGRKWVGGLSAAGAAAAVVLFFKFYYWPDFLDWYVQIIGAVAFGAMFLNAERDNPINRMLSSSPLLFIGKISYSLYLFHYLGPRIVMPLMQRLGVDLTQTFRYDLLLLQALTMTACLAVAIGIAAVTYRLIEMPGQYWLRRWLLKPPPVEEGR